jgi:uncharacterized protein (TIGR00251 family)
MVSSAVTSIPGGVRLALRIVTRAKRSGLDSVRDGRLIVRVTAPPVDGAANDAVVGVLASALGVPKRAVSIAQGEHSRNKVVSVSGLGTAEVIAALGRR